MALNTIFGINGVGKDTVANVLRADNPNLSVTSMSRMLMYILGITKSYDVSEKASEEQYKKLEGIPQERMIEIENTEYKKLLSELSKSDENVLMLAHLILALRHGDKINYLTDRTIPDWYVNLNASLIQLVAPFELISARRKNDLSRKRKVDISEIEYHQSLCDDEWERIKRMNPAAAERMYVVNNIGLYETADEIENLMYSGDAKVLQKIRGEKR